MERRCRCGYDGRVKSPNFPSNEIKPADSMCRVPISDAVISAVVRRYACGREAWRDRQSERHMDSLAATDVVVFERFRLDRRGDGLSRLDDNGVYRPVALGSRALDVLSILVQR